MTRLPWRFFPVPHSLLSALFLPALLVGALTLAACDTAQPDPTPSGPTPLAPMPPDQQALVAEAFADLEALFALGFEDSATSPSSQAKALAPLAPIALSAVTDTTTYTGVYDATAAKGYLATLQYRTPQGVGVWSARVQHARAVDHDQNAATAALDAIETVTLTFLTYGDLEAFLTALEAGAIPYLVGTSDDAEASLSGYDTWRVAQVYAPTEGEAIVSYANAELRESVTVRDPVVTRNADGTGNVRDGGPDGAARTRYYGADFAIAADGSVSGTLLRTLLSAGDTADGSVVSRTEYPDGSFRQTRQRGGNGLVVRENTSG